MEPILHTTDLHIGIIGLGYVGLPLAVEFGRHFPVTGFDINPVRVAELQNGHDSTLEIEASELHAATYVRYSTDLSALAECNVYIITVPTPVDSSNRPDMNPLRAASCSVGSLLKRGDTVIYESTVYPGATEEVCVPLLSQHSGLIFNQDFFVGYSPERINPGDKHHRLTTICKVTSGSTASCADFVDALYRRIISAGTYKVSSLRVAEAAKVIENAQRDVNIAFVNELALIFNRLSIDTEEVLHAAGSKWNFLPFRPGLVGGHCIGIDPYYLAHKAQEVGYHPELILAARRINNNMSQHVVNQVLRLMLKHRLDVVAARILVLGVTFKENCPDLRNTRVVEIVRELRSLNAEVEIYDPWVKAAELEAEYGLSLIPTLLPGRYDAIIIAVAHQQFHNIADIRALGKPSSVIYDIKHLLPAALVDGRL
jgi:UDP-N-acetyl-D-glucosamine/UDP-N-acetyl-D-galactosamine dehydrogenase